MKELQPPRLVSHGDLPGPDPEGPTGGQLQPRHQLQEGLPAAVLADHGLGIVRHLAVDDGQRRDGASGLVKPQRHLERHPSAEGVAQQVDGPRGAGLAQPAEVVLGGRLDGGMGRRLPVEPARLQPVNRHRRVQRRHQVDEGGDAASRARHAEKGRGAGRPAPERHDGRTAPGRGRRLLPRPAERARERLAQRGRVRRPHHGQVRPRHGRYPEPGWGVEGAPAVRRVGAPAVSGGEQVEQDGERLRNVLAPGGFVAAQPVAHPPGLRHGDVPRKEPLVAALPDERFQVLVPGRRDLLVGLRPVRRGVGGA